MSMKQWVYVSFAGKYLKATTKVKDNVLQPTTHTWVDDIDEATRRSEPHHFGLEPLVVTEQGYAIAVKVTIEVMTHE